MAGCGLSRHEAGRIQPHPSTTDIQGYDLGDQEIIDIQASEGVSVSIVDGRREEVGKLSCSLDLRRGDLKTLSLRWSDFSYRGRHLVAILRYCSIPRPVYIVNSSSVVNKPM